MKIPGLLFAGYLMLMLQACEQQAVVRYHPHENKKVTTVKHALMPIKHDTLCITAVGDIMLGTSYPNKNTLPPDSAKNSFTAIQKYLNGTDIAFGNLEGTLLDTGAPAHYKLHLKSTAYLFRMPVRCGRVLKDAGFNVLSIANNHIGDFDDKGRLSTMKTLDSCGINYAGLLTHATSRFEVNGTKYGFCAFAPNAQTVSILDLKNAAQVISDLKQQCDVLIVAFHGGCEGPQYEHITFKGESYFGEKRGNVHAFAHTAIDAGADIVLGTGPHVSRAMEIYKGRFVAYSLGNFCTYKCISVEGVCGIAPLLKIYTNKKGEFLNGRIIAVKQTHEKGLEPDSLNRAIKRIKFLTETDFPQGGLMIAADGTITKQAVLDTDGVVDTLARR